MKQTGMLVVSLRGVNFGFWSRLGYSGQSANIFSQISEHYIFMHISGSTELMTLMRISLENLFLLQKLSIDYANFSQR